MYRYASWFLWTEVDTINGFGPSSALRHSSSLFQAADWGMALVLMFVFLSYQVNYDKRIVAFNAEDCLWGMCFQFDLIVFFVRDAFLKSESQLVSFNWFHSDFTAPIPVVYMKIYYGRFAPNTGKRLRWNFVNCIICKKVSISTQAT